MGFKFFFWDLTFYSGLRTDSWKIIFFSAKGKICLWTFYRTGWIETGRKTGMDGTGGHLWFPLFQSPPQR